MTGAQSRFDLYSRRILNSAVPELDAEPDPVKRFRKYAYTITNSEHAAIEPLISEAEATVDESDPEPSVTVRLDPDIADHFKKAGGDWQRRINDVLRASIKQR
ncbi:MAG: BrnA antitoxin family protein [Pseudomonadota bacterium]